VGSSSSAQCWWGSGMILSEVPRGGFGGVLVVLKSL